MSHLSSLRKGITWRSMLGLIYIIVVFQPASLYMMLATGTSLGAFVQWATLILFVEIARLTGSPLTQQEAALIFLGSWLSTMYVVFTGYSFGSTNLIGLLYPIYYRNSDIVKMFSISDEIPSFYAPPSTEVWLSRTFFASEWLLPIIVVLIWYALVYIADLSLGLFMRRIYIEVERLPYPTTIPVAEACKLLSSRKKDHLRIFYFSAVIGAIYGTILYGLPFISSIVVGVEYRPIPIPWIDWNRYIHLVFPGASLGIATDAMYLATGLIIPFNLVIAAFIGSFMTQFLGNHILYRLKLTKFSEEWVFGMNIMDSYTRSTLYVWASLLIGVGVSIGIIPLIRHPNLLLNAFKPSKYAKNSSNHTLYTFYSLWKVLVPYVLATLGISILGYLLVPTINFLLLLLINCLLPFIIALIMGRSIGTAVPFNFPYVRELVLIATNVRGSAWFIPVYLGYISDWTSGFKIAELTNLHYWDYVKATSLLVPFALLMGFIWTARFWSIAPIPSAFYPGIEVGWKINAIYQSLFYRASPEIFNRDLLLTGVIVAGAAFLIADKFNLSALIIAGASGLGAAIPISLSMLIGGIIGKIIENKIGRTFWEEYRGIMSGGIIMGEGTAVVLFTCILLLTKSIWFLPY